VKKGEKSEKSEKSAITYLLNYAGLIMLPSNLIAPPVMQKVVQMTIIGLLG
jgi:hypothetical protein